MIVCREKKGRLVNLNLVVFSCLEGRGSIKRKKGRIIRRIG